MGNRQCRLLLKGAAIARPRLDVSRLRALPGTHPRLASRTRTILSARGRLAQPLSELRFGVELGHQVRAPMRYPTSSDRHLVADFDGGTSNPGGQMPAAATRTVLYRTERRAQIGRCLTWLEMGGYSSPAEAPLPHRHVRSNEDGRDEAVAPDIAPPTTTTDPLIARSSRREASSWFFAVGDIPSTLALAAEGFIQSMSVALSHEDVRTQATPALSASLGEMGPGGSLSYHRRIRSRHRLWASSRDCSSHPRVILAPGT